TVPAGDGLVRGDHGKGPVEVIVGVVDQQRAIRRIQRLLGIIRGLEIRTRIERGDRLLVQQPVARGEQHRGAQHEKYRFHRQMVQVWSLHDQNPIWIPVTHVRAEGTVPQSMPTLRSDGRPSPRVSFALAWISGSRPGYLVKVSAFWTVR